MPFLFRFLAIIVLFFPFTALAQGDSTTTTTTTTTETVEEVEAPPFEPIQVDLGVPIGGVKTLQTASEEGGVISVPFLGQYINAVYRYMAGIVMVVAIVMVVYGGFRYLVGSTSGDIARGKQIILDAIMGLILVLTAYGILQTINPATLDFGALQLSNVKLDPLAASEADIDFGHATDPSYRPRSPGVPYASTDLANLEMCEQLAQYVNDGTLLIPDRADRAGILGGTGFIRRPSGSTWCQLSNDTKAGPTCDGLKTRAEFDRAVDGHAVNFDDTADGVPINPMLCRYLLDLSQAKARGEIHGTIQAKIIGTHHRCALGAWYFRGGEKTNGCEALVPGRQRCIRCIESIISGPSANSGQSDHWTGQAFDLSPQNNEVQQYTVNVLAPRYREENGGNAVFDNVFGGVIAPSEGTPNCTTRRGTIRTKAYCVHGDCGSPTEFVTVGSDAVCGHYSGGAIPHVHVSFY